jgi:phage protein D
MSDSKKNKKTKKSDKAKSTTKTKSAKQASAKKAAAAKASASKPKTARKGKAPANPDAKPVVVVSHDQIARKAYEIWLAKGKPHGQDEQNWLEAKSALENA